MWLEEFLDRGANAVDYVHYSLPFAQFSREILMLHNLVFTFG